MPFTKNSNGTKTWTNSSGTFSTTRDSHGNLLNRTTTSSNGNHSTSVNYSNGKTTSVSRTHNGHKSTKKGW